MLEFFWINDLDMFKFFNVLIFKSRNLRRENENYFVNIILFSTELVFNFLFIKNIYINTYDYQG